MYLTNELATVTNLLEKHRHDNFPRLGLWAENKKIVLIQAKNTTQKNNLILPITKETLHTGPNGREWAIIRIRIHQLKKGGKL